MVKFLNTSFILFCMEAIITSYRRSIKTQKTNQILLDVNANSKEEAEKFIGKKVVYTTEGNKTIEGEIVAVHGNKGIVRAIMSRGMPGQSLGKKVLVQ